MRCTALNLGKRKPSPSGDYWVNYVSINAPAGAFAVMKSGGESTNKGFYFAVFEFLNKQITKFVSHFFLHRFQLNNAQNQYRTIASDNAEA